MCYSRFMAGDTSAYDELMIRYGDSLTIYLNGYLHDWYESEDLMIEAFARIMVKRPKIRAGGFKAYLFKTARNLASRFASKKKRLNAFSIEEMETELPDEYLTENHVLDKEKRAALKICMDRIDPDCREAVWLVYVEGISYEAAANVMGVSKKKVDNLLLKGKKLLREELIKEGVTDAH